MALPTNAFATYEAIGNREDLADVIYRIDPTDTPFMSGVEKAKASAVLHEWQTQALASASSTNAQLEGDDATTSAHATWTVEMRQRPMRLAASIAHPLLVWGHDRVVDATVDGFRRRLLGEAGGQ